MLSAASFCPENLDACVQPGAKTETGH